LEVKRRLYKEQKIWLQLQEVSVGRDVGRDDTKKFVGSLFEFLAGTDFTPNYLRVDFQVTSERASEREATSSKPCSTHRHLTLDNTPINATTHTLQATILLWLLIR
jgi:hypothetical protein